MHKNDSASLSSQKTLREPLPFIILTVLLVPGLPLFIAITALAIGAFTLWVKGNNLPHVFVAGLLTGALALFYEIHPEIGYFADHYSAIIQHLFGFPVALAITIVFSKCSALALVATFMSPRDKHHWRLVFLNGTALLLTFLAIQLSALTAAVELADLGIWFLVYHITIYTLNLLFIIAIFREHPSPHPIRAQFMLTTCMLLLAVLAADAISGYAHRDDAMRSISERVLVFTPAQQSAASSAEFRSSLDAHGLASIGLYGDLPRILSMMGYTVTRSATLQEHDLTGAGIVVCPTFSRFLNGGELEALQRWLEAGGYLLVVAEHTDLQGNASAINKLSARLGIRVEFTTTDGFYGEGLTGSRTSFSKLAWAFDASPILTVNRGASLQINPLRASPLLIGEDWFADYGDSLNVAEAFMGDRVLSEGDKVGGVALAATAKVGRGRIVVIGDSSPFLNQNIAYSVPVIANLMAALHSQDAAVEWTFRLVLALATGIAAQVLWRFLPRRLNESKTLAAIVISLLALHFSIRQTSQANDLLSSGNTAVISISENNDWYRDEFSARSTTALGVNLFRQGYLPRYLDWYSERRHLPNVLIIFRPTRIPDPQYLSTLRQVTESGSLMLIAGDGNQKTFRDIAATFGVSVEQFPLGAQADSTLVAFSPWLVSHIPTTAKPVYANRQLIGATVSYGKGRVTILADGGFCYTTNLESENTYSPQNLDFLRSIVGKNPESLPR